MNWAGHWLTPQEFAKVMDRPARTVREWADNGTLVEFGLSVYCVSRGHHNTRTFIYTTAELVDK